MRPARSRPQAGARARGFGRLGFFPLVLLLGIGPGPLAAQEPEALVRIDRMIDEGRFGEGRESLERWLDLRWDEAPRGDREHALWLRALLTVDPTFAEMDYRRIVVEYPGGRFADRALLRLAHSALAHDDPPAARRYLDILLRDYPGSSERLEARTLLARISGGTGVPPESDSAPPVGGPETPPPRAESRPEPAPTGGLPTAGSVDADRLPAAVGNGATGRSSSEADSATHPFTVQIGAFSEASIAAAFASDPRLSGVELRFVRVAGSPLVRIRTGAFATREAAESMREALERMGIPSLLAADRATETAVP